MPENNSVSAKAWKDFKQSFLWRELHDELSIWEENIRMELAEPTFDPGSKEMSFSRNDRVMYDEYLRGCLKAVVYFKQLPEVIITHKEADAEKED